MKVSVKAGRFTFDPQTKKVKPLKQKGLITVYQNQEQQTHFSWSNTNTHIEELDLIVFPSDAVFEAVHDKSNTYILKFITNQDRYFFWLQEKVAVENIVLKINQVIDCEPLQQEKMDVQGENSKMDAEGVQPPAQPVPKLVVQPAPHTASQQAALPKMFNDDFIKKMQQNLSAANKKLESSLTHLGNVLGSQTISFIVNQCTEEQKCEIAQYLPSEQSSPKNLRSNMMSPQFLQAIDAFSEALNSDNAISLFMELGLDRRFLNKYYGAHAFLKALEDWALTQPQMKNPKSEQKQCQQIVIQQSEDAIKEEKGNQMIEEEKEKNSNGDDMNVEKQK